MRRNDREISDDSKIIEIVKNCDCCHLGMIDDGKAYIVPLNFVYTENRGARVFYFHSAKEGKKIDLLKKQEIVSFEMDCNHSVKVGETACRYGFYFQSVMGSGRVAFVTALPEKKLAMELLMARYSAEKDWHFNDEQVAAVEIIKLEITEWSGKECK